MKIKVSEASGVVLDWLVAGINGYPCEVVTARNGVKWIRAQHPLFGWTDYGPSTDWSQGGPIFERERICPCPASTAVGSPWSATDLTGHITQFGPTPLIAAMRCYVASKLGEIVEVPDELSS